MNDIKYRDSHYLPSKAYTGNISQNAHDIVLTILG